MSKEAFQEYFGGRNQIQSCSSPFLTKSIYQLNSIQPYKILIIHNSFQYFSFFTTSFTKNMYFTFLKSFFTLSYLSCWQICNRIRSYLTSDKPRYNRSIMFNVDDSRNMSILIKPTSLSHLQCQISVSRWHEPENSFWPDCFLFLSIYIST